MKQIFKHFLILLAFVAYSISGFSQTDSLLPSGKKPRYYILETDTVPDIMYVPDTIPTNKRKRKAPKKKKKVFYDLKCKKGYVKTISGTGKTTTLEKFYYLKEWKDPNPYIPDIYVWDLSKNKVIKVSKIDAEKQPLYRVLHGPYFKEINGEVVESGAFYVGTKHARWEQYDKYGLLIGKAKFYKGWPKEAKINYYDASQRKPKEVIPYDYGKLEGDYYLFGEKGDVLTSGQYKEGVKVGLWIDYFPNSPNRKRETVYPSDPYDTTTQPIIQKEWNEKGKIVILDGVAIPEGSKQQDAVDPIKSRLKRKRY